jgi:hypothetical protein
MGAQMSADAGELIDLEAFEGEIIQLAEARFAENEPVT